MVRKAVIGGLVAGALLFTGCKDNASTKEMVSNTRTYTSQSSMETVTDMDFDGKYDVLESWNVGGMHRLFFKRGYGPSQDPGIEIEFVDPSFFKSYDEEQFRDMVKKYYRLEEK
ncbi:MAG TPA: hypothetical protein ENH99_00085 [Candidatus Pacearchaeota archaeon]|nr:hypothetical protein [Candidatus Pacearchaeota archaeon]